MARDEARRDRVARFRFRSGNPLSAPCPRCNVWAVEGDRFAGYVCCWCDWDHDKHQAGVPLIKNGARSVVRSEHEQVLVVRTVPSA
jgi:hypothetical protein